MRPNLLPHSARRLRLALACLALYGAFAQADPLAALGRALFFDPNLSEPPGQACATCHDPSRAFSDPSGALEGALSIGADGRSLGERNTPSLTYVAMVPTFGNASGHYQGGLFLDGRAATLEAQALEPMLNPLEMALPNEAALIERVRDNPAYRKTLLELFGSDALDTESATLRAITTAIAAFERSRELSTFDSRYDRYLTGEYEMTREEAIGRDLFFSSLVNCIQCHLNQPGQVSERETFTSHRYHNIGVPRNPDFPGRPDPGLAGHLDNPAEAGKFRVPSLRNVAVTAPYMHNGLFQNLETAVAFYAKYTLRDHRNPETGTLWRPAEIPESVDLEILAGGQPIHPARIQHLTAFLKTLTDRRYEHLLD